MRQDVEDFLKELERQQDQGQRQTQIDGRQQPAGGVKGFFDQTFHADSLGLPGPGEYTGAVQADQCGRLYLTQASGPTWKRTC